MCPKHYAQMRHKDNTVCLHGHSCANAQVKNTRVPTLVILQLTYSTLLLCSKLRTYFLTDDNRNQQNSLLLMRSCCIGSPRALVHARLPSDTAVALLWPLVAATHLLQ